MSRTYPVFNVRRDPDPARRAPWGVHWNEYAPGRTGRPKNRSKWFDTEAAARRWADEMGTLARAAVLNPAAVVEPTRPRRADSLAALAGNHADLDQISGWLRYVKDNNAPKTFRGYRSDIRNYLAPDKGHARYPGLGDLVVSDAHLTRKVVLDYLNALHAAGVSLATRMSLKATLSALCTYAVDETAQLTFNPLLNRFGRKVRKVTEPVRRPDPSPFERDDIGRIFDQLEAVEDLPWLVYFWFLYDTGVRPGEAGALKWAVVDLDRGVAMIESSACESGVDKDPKTHNAREIVFSDRTIELLLKWRAEQKREALRRGIKVPVYVFTTRRLARVRPNGDNMYDVFDRVMAACKITGHSPYDFRHSFASFHLSENWDQRLTFVSKQLGHATPLTTAKHYYRYRPKTAARGFVNESAREITGGGKGWSR